MRLTVSILPLVGLPCLEFLSCLSLSSSCQCNCPLLCHVISAMPVPKGARQPLLGSSPCLARSAMDGGDPRLSPGASNTDGEPEHQDEGHAGGKPEHEDLDLEPEKEGRPHPYGQAGCRSPQLADGTCVLRACSMFAHPAMDCHPNQCTHYA